MKEKYVRKLANGGSIGLDFSGFQNFSRPTVGSVNPAPRSVSPQPFFTALGVEQTRQQNNIRMAGELRRFTSAITSQLASDIKSSTSNSTGLDFTIPSYVALAKEMNESIEKVTNEAFSDIMSGDYKGSNSKLMSLQNLKQDRRYATALKNSSILKSMGNQVDKLQKSTAFSNNELGIKNEQFIKDFTEAKKIISQNPYTDLAELGYGVNDYRIDYKKGREFIDNAVNSYKNVKGKEILYESYKGKAGFGKHMDALLANNLDKETYATMLAEMAYEDGNARGYLKNAGYISGPNLSPLIKYFEGRLETEGSPEYTKVKEILDNTLVDYKLPDGNVVQVAAKDVSTLGVDVGKALNDLYVSKNRPSGSSSGSSKSTNNISTTIEKDIEDAYGDGLSTVEVKNLAEVIKEAHTRKYSIDKVISELAITDPNQQELMRGLLRRNFDYLDRVSKGNTTTSSASSSSSRSSSGVSPERMEEITNLFKGS